MVLLETIFTFFFVFHSFWSSSIFVDLVRMSPTRVLSCPSCCAIRNDETSSSKNISDFGLVAILFNSYREGTLAKHRCQTFTDQKLKSVN